MATSLSFGTPGGSLSSALGGYGSNSQYSFGSGVSPFQQGHLAGVGMPNIGVPVPAPAPLSAPVVAPMPTPTVPTVGAEAGAVAGNPQTPGVPQDLSFGGMAKGLLWENGKLNLGGLKSVAEIAGALGGLWGGFQQNKLAKEMLSTQREAYKTNLSNQIDTYNTSLTDRINSRYAQEGRSAAEASDYIAQNKLGK